MSTIHTIAFQTAGLREVRWLGMDPVILNPETSPRPAHAGTITPFSFEKGNLFGGKYQGRARFT
jgi:hypothetical protein